MKEMKYVVVRPQPDHETLLPEELYIFPKNITHAYFAENMSHVRREVGRDWERYYCEVVSAGFTDGKTCYGMSESLGVSSRPEDTRLLNGS